MRGFMQSGVICVRSGSRALQKRMNRNWAGLGAGYFLPLTGGASPVEKIAPPVFLTCPPKILLHVRRFIISFL